MVSANSGLFCLTLFESSPGPILPVSLEEIKMAQGVSKCHVLQTAQATCAKAHTKYGFLQPKEEELLMPVTTDRGLNQRPLLGTLPSLLDAMKTKFSKVMTCAIPLLTLKCLSPLTLFQLIIFGLLFHTTKTESDIIVQHQESFKARVCNKSLHLPAYATGSLVLHTLYGKHGSYCIVKIYAEDASFRVRLTFDNTADVTRKDLTYSNRSYLHLGNNMKSVDIESLTSYKVCLGSPVKEFVSRGPATWLVLSSEMSSAFLSFSYEILPEVHCQNKSVFACSDVQCISRDQVCDGLPQCSNGLDEYCGMTTGDSCFQCLDGTCIKPRLPAYSTENGKKWWWLCDQYPHCPDDTDEIQGICYGLESRSNELFECTPTGHHKDDNVTVMLLTTQLCDGLTHCEDAADEDHSKCHALIERARIRSEAIYVPLIAITIFSLVMFVIGKHCEKKAASRDRFHVIADGTSASRRQSGRRAMKTIQADESIDLQPITEV